MVAVCVSVASDSDHLPGTLATDLRLPSVRRRWPNTDLPPSCARALVYLSTDSRLSVGCFPRWTVLKWPGARILHCRLHSRSSVAAATALNDCVVPFIGRQSLCCVRAKADSPS